MLRYLDKVISISLCLCLTASLVSAQQAVNNDRLWIKADRAMEIGDYMGALQLYEQIYQSDSLSQELNYKMGVCSFEIRRLRKASSKFFDKVSADEYVEIYYYKGRLNHLNGKYQDAITHYSDYKSMKGFKAYDNDEVNVLIDKAKTAVEFELKADGQILVKNLGETVNTPYPEYAPLIPANESSLFFTSRRMNDVWQGKDPLGDYFEDIYSCVRKDNTWQSPVMLDTCVNTKMHDACTGLSADGKKLLIFRTGADLFSGNIMETDVSKGECDAPSLLGSIVNSEDFAETSACYSPEGDIIFFSSNRPGGYGGKDLYAVKKLPNGEWGIPYNLGPEVNTEYNEDAPFVHPSGSILYFCSEGHENMGGYDIFECNFDESGKFSNPNNLGYPINTNDDDVFFVMNADASVGYLSSERDGGFGSQDIYAVHFSGNETPLNVYNVHLYGDDKELIKKAEISLTSLETGKRFGKYKTNRNNGKLIILSEKKKVYKVTIKAQGFETLTFEATLDDDTNLTYVLTPKKR